jgi:GTP-binding protein EngB required for normal cell division
LEFAVNRPHREDDSYLGFPARGIVTDSLNSSQKLRLLSGFQYADKLLADIESILDASASKPAFPRYQPDLSPAQAKIVRDYIERIRSEMVRVLESQGVFLPEPQFGSVRSIRITLGFAGIAFDECRAKALSGYGELPDSVIPEINGLVGEMKGLVEKLDGYLSQGLGQDLQLRLEKLQTAGADVGTVSTLERVIHAHGFVELRSALTNIVTRLESTSFEIAVFGRVSSGKSSLLNRILDRDVLPVGVNPVTSVPTRIAYGPVPRGAAWFAGDSPRQFEIERLPEFVTEQFNPQNTKHVTRIVVELPSPRLRDGMVYVDTPGLGSLATAGSAETLAYLPRCDLGIVLVDAGATLAADDLSTIRTLYEAGIPAMVLLSKADLLAADDLEQVRRYASQNIESQLGLKLPVHAVSVKAEHARLLERWFQQEIGPLYDHHVELARQSLSRKIAVLRNRVEDALRSKLKHSEASTPDVDSELRAIGASLRIAAGRFDEVRSQSFRISDQMRELGAAAVERTAGLIIDSGKSETAIAALLEQAAADHAAPVASLLRDLAEGLTDTLVKAATALGMDGPDKNELMAVLTDMPRLDLGNLSVDFRINNLVLRMSRGWATRRLEQTLWHQAGPDIAAAFSNHGKLLEAWIRSTFADLQARFDSYADAYRAQMDRLACRQTGTVEDGNAVRRDLAALEAGVVV